MAGRRITGLALGLIATLVLSTAGALVLDSAVLAYLALLTLGVIVLTAFDEARRGRAPRGRA